MKRNQHLSQVANSTMQKKDEEFEMALEKLVQNDSLGQRWDRSLDHVWREYNEFRRQMKQIEERLLEVEIHEERLAELDDNDWRG